MPKIYDQSGSFIGDTPPTPLTGQFCRVAHYRSEGKPVTMPDGQVELKYETIRAQVPYLITFLVYNSQFELEPTKREYFIYGPNNLTYAVQRALALWKKWENTRKADDYNAFDESSKYPRMEHGATAEPIDDATFQELWEATKRGKYKAAGHPDDPWAFTCLDDRVKLYRTGDFQAGHDHKIS